MSLPSVRQSHRYERFHLQSSCENGRLCLNRTRVKNVVGCKLELGEAQSVFAKRPVGHCHTAYPMHSNGLPAMRLTGFTRAFTLTACLGIGFLGLSITGCGPKSAESTADSVKPPVAADELEHVHDENHVHAETYPEAIAQLETMRNDIRDAFAKGEGMSADETVHAVAHALEDVTALAKKASLSEEDQVAVGTAVESLFDAFSRIDEKLHGGEGADYSDVASEIDAAFEVLNKYVPAAK